MADADHVAVEVAEPLPVGVWLTKGPDKDSAVLTGVQWVDEDGLANFYLTPGTYWLQAADGRAAQKVDLRYLAGDPDTLDGVGLRAEGA